MHQLEKLLHIQGGVFYLIVGIAGATMEKTAEKCLLFLSSLCVRYYFFLIIKMEDYNATSGELLGKEMLQFVQ